MKTRDVHLELRAVEPADELNHLALGAANFEAGQHKGDAVRTMRHSGGGSKRSAIEMAQFLEPHLPRRDSSYHFLLNRHGRVEPNFPFVHR